MLRKKLDEHLQDTGRSQGYVARALGVSTSAVSQYLNNKPKGDVAKLESKIESFLSREKERKSSPKKPGFVETLASKQVREVISIAHTGSVIGLIYGPAGIGKTVSVQEYVKEKGGFLITADVSFTMKGMVEELAEKCGVIAKGTVREVTKRLIQFLKNTGRLIIVDEAQFLPIKAVEILRKIHDETGCGLVLVGMPRLYNQMMGRGSEIYAQLFSRVGIRRYITNVQLEDVERIARQVIPTNGKAPIKWLYNKARQDGAYRSMIQNLWLAQRLAKKNKAPISVELLERTEKYLMV